MAESLLVELGKSIVEKVGSEVWKTVVGAADIDAQIKGLQDIKTTLEATFRDANSSQLCTDSQRDVFEKLDCVLAKLIDFQDAKDAKAKQKELMGGSKVTKEARLFFSTGSNQLVTPFKDARKMTGNRCSWEFAERCEEPSGEDWPKIQHIPNISIEPAKNE